MLLIFTKVIFSLAAKEGKLGSYMKTDLVALLLSIFLVISFCLLLSHNSMWSPGAGKNEVFKKSFSIYHSICKGRRIYGYI